jgi:hypothetical protein
MRDGLSGLPVEVVKARLATGYGFPAHFVEAAQTGSLLLSALVHLCPADLLVSWCPQQTEWKSLKPLIGQASSPSYYCGKRVGVVSIENPGAVAMVAWLGAACDYPLVAPRVESRIFLVGARSWVAHVYDDRGMDVAFVDAEAAQEFSELLRKKGCLHVVA